jgi:hypothetical protein
MKSVGHALSPFRNHDLSTAESTSLETNSSHSSPTHSKQAQAMQPSLKRFRRHSLGVLLAGASVFGKAGVVCLCVFLDLAPLLAQTPTGRIVGTARDHDGQPVTNATIQVFDHDSHKPLASASVIISSYMIDKVPSGFYYLTSQVAGYKPLTSSTVTVSAPNTTVADLVFDVEPSKLLSQWVKISGSFGAVIFFAFSLWWPRYLIWRNRPVLLVEINKGAPFSHWIDPQFPRAGVMPESRPKLPPELESSVASESTSPQPEPSSKLNIDIFFCRLKVTNKGRGDAEKVQVTVRRAFKSTGNQASPWRTIENFVPLDLRWSNTWDITKAGEDTTPADGSVLIRDQISAKGERHCDLGFLIDHDRYEDFCRRTGIRDHLPKPQTVDRFIIAFEFIRTLDRHSLEPGKHKLEIVVNALHIEKPKSFWVELNVPNRILAPKKGRPKEPPAGFDASCSDKPPEGITS